MDPDFEVDYKQQLMQWKKDKDSTKENFEEMEGMLECSLSNKEGKMLKTKYFLDRFMLKVV